MGEAGYRAAFRLVDEMRLVGTLRECPFSEGKVALERLMLKRGQPDELATHLCGYLARFNSSISWL